MVILAVPPPQPTPEPEPKPDYDAALAVFVQSIDAILRDQRGDQTYAEQAKAIGISATTLRAFHAGRPPSLTTLLKCMLYLSR